MKQKILILILFCLVLLVLPRAKADISTGLVGYWRLDEGSGTSILDSSDFSNNGTLINTASWVNGKYNYGLNFSTSTGYVNIPDSVSLRTVADWTKSFWFYTNIPSGGDGSNHDFFVQRTTTNKFHFRIATNGEWDVYYNSSSLGYVAIALSAKIIGSWVFMVIVKLGTNITVYENNINVGSSNTCTNEDLDSHLTTLGGWSSAYYCNSTIDEIRIYDYALSLQSILELYNGFEITSSSDLGITISPEGNTTIGAGQSQIYSIVPKIGYSLNTFYIDGILQGIASGSYTFSNTVSNHTIYATSFLLPQNPTNIDVNYYLFGGGRYVGLILVIIALFLVNFLHKYSFLITVTLAFLLTLLYLRQTPPLVWEGILTLFVGIILMLTGVLKIRR